MGRCLEIVFTDLDQDEQFVDLHAERFAELPNDQRVEPSGRAPAVKAECLPGDR
jgi:hypothetical protein